MSAPPCVKGDEVIVRCLGAKFTGTVTAANDAVIVVLWATGFSAHIRYNAALGDWTLGGARASITKEAAAMTKRFRSMNWDDPAARLELMDRVGVDEYNRLFAEHVDRTTVATVAGRIIRPVNTRFGVLFEVRGTGKAFRTQEEAEQYARENPRE